MKYVIDIELSREYTLTIGVHSPMFWLSHSHIRSFNREIEIAI